MTKRCDISDVRKKFEEEGYTLLEKEYKNNHTKLEYICPKGNYGKTPWGSFKQGHRCPCCHGKNIKPTIEKVKALFEKDGYLLMSDVYNNSHTKMWYKCPENHVHSISLNKWNMGRRCPTCANKNRGARKKLSYSFVKNSFEKEGYTLLSSEYKNAATKLKYLCNNGHKHEIVWGSFYSGRRCPECYGKNIKLTIEEVKTSFEEREATLLDKVYVNSNTKLNYICSDGHRQTITWDSWKRGSSCSVCAGITKLNIEYIRSEFDKEKYILLEEEYKGNKSKLSYKCPVGHIHNVSWGKWYFGRRCPTCAVIKQTGPGHHNWKGGISCEPYCQDWTKAYKEYIKERDGYKCLNPYCNNNKTRLSVHHIDYNKKNCSPTNLITVCISCNAKANTDREWHESWYKAIMLKRYNVGSM